MWDLYKAALSTQERRGIPIVGASVERRVFEYTTHVYNDERIRSLICFACAQVKVDTGGIRSDIGFRSGRWLFSLPKGSLQKNFSMAEFTRRYRKPGSPLAPRGSGVADVPTADFSDWTLQLHPDYMTLLRAQPEQLRDISVGDLQALAATELLCCPEDHSCRGDCAQTKILCPRCRVPICRSCRELLHENVIIPQGLHNDNWWGYIEAFIYEKQVTWMEKTVSCLYWTGILLFTIGRRGQERKSNRQHTYHDAMYSLERRVAFKGQLYSAPMDWANIQAQLESMDNNEVQIALPVTGALLEARVRVCVTSGLIDLNRYIREATVRREVVVQLIRMLRDRGHPDYRSVNMDAVRRRAKELASTDEPTIPNGLLDLLEASDDERLDDSVDKAAPPAERISNEEELELEMSRARPQLLVPQRDTDALKDVEASRMSALSSISELSIRTGSKLLDQFQTNYIPRVFNMTLPWCVGGPDFPGQPRTRRKFDDAPTLSLDAFTSMMAARVEAQIRWDWDLNPGLWSLSFASKVNLGVSMSLQRSMRRAEEAPGHTDAAIGKAAARIYELLWEGEYEEGGRRRAIRGDVSKISLIRGLGPTEQMLLRNYHFMSSRLAGTRQLRRRVNHVVFSGRVVYGCPVFLTVTPSERHSGLTIRLMRYRRNDPALRESQASATFRRWCGYNEPSLFPPADATPEIVEIDLPEYDLRRIMTSRDPLCALYAFFGARNYSPPTAVRISHVPRLPALCRKRQPMYGRFREQRDPHGWLRGQM